MVDSIDKTNLTVKCVVKFTYLIYKSERIS